MSGHADPVPCDPAFTAGFALSSVCHTRSRRWGIFSSFQFSEMLPTCAQIVNRTILKGHTFISNGVPYMGMKFPQFSETIELHLPSVIGSCFLRTRGQKIGSSTDTFYIP